MNHYDFRSVYYGNVESAWRGCKKCSDGCLHCYIHKGDFKRKIDTTKIVKTKDFEKPTEKFKNGNYKIKSGIVYLGWRESNPSRLTNEKNPVFIASSLEIRQYSCGTQLQKHKIFSIWQVEEFLPMIFSGGKA